MESEKKRKSYERQFKIDAVNLVVNGNRSVSSVARDLGIEVNLLHRWKRELTGRIAVLSRERTSESTGGRTAPATS